MNRSIENESAINEFYIEVYSFAKEIFKEKLSVNGLQNIKKVAMNLESILKNIFKNLDENVDINFYFHLKEYENFIRKFPIRKEDFIKIFLIAQAEKKEAFLSSPEVKKIITETLGELPICLSRVYNIDIGIEVKSDGSTLTLKEYSLLCNESYETNQKLLESAKNLLEKKVKRKLERRKI